MPGPNGPAGLRDLSHQVHVDSSGVSTTLLLGMVAVRGWGCPGARLAGQVGFRMVVS